MSGNFTDWRQNEETTNKVNCSEKQPRPQRLFPLFFLKSENYLSLISDFKYHEMKRNGDEDGEKNNFKLSFMS